MKNKNLVKKLETFEKLAVYGSKSSFLKRLAQEADIVFPDDSITSTRPNYPTIPTSVQMSLNYLSQEARTPLNLKVDGVLGPKTRAGLNWFATANGMVGKADKDLFAAIELKQKEAVSKATKQPNVPGPTSTEPQEMSNIKAPISRV